MTDDTIFDAAVNVFTPEFKAGPNFAANLATLKAADKKLGKGEYLTEKDIVYLLYAIDTAQEKARTEGGEWKVKDGKIEIKQSDDVTINKTLDEAVKQFGAYNKEQAGKAPADKSPEDKSPADLLGELPEATVKAMRADVHQIARLEIQREAAIKAAKEERDRQAEKVKDTTDRHDKIVNAAREAYTNRYKDPKEAVVAKHLLETELEDAKESQKGTGHITRGVSYIADNPKKVAGFVAAVTALIAWLWPSKKEEQELSDGTVETKSKMGFFKIAAVTTGCILSAALIANLTPGPTRGWIAKMAMPKSPSAQVGPAV